MTVNHGLKSEFAELRHVFQVEKGGSTFTLALVSIYSEPDREVWEKSHGAVHVVDYIGDEEIQIVDATTIIEVVGLLPFPRREGADLTYPEFFLLERMALGGSAPPTITNAGVDEDEFHQ